MRSRFAVQAAIALFLLMVVPGWAQLTQGNTRPIVMVTLDTSGSMEYETYPSLDEAAEGVATLTDPLILVSPGEYTLSSPIRTGLEIRAASLGSGSLQPIDWYNCGPGQSAASSGPPHVVLNSSSTSPAVQVQLSNPEGLVTLAGVELRSTSSQPAALLTGGQVIVREGRVIGRLVTKGPQASTALSNVELTAAGLSGPPGPIPPRSGDGTGGAGRYGLSFSPGDCDVAAVSVTGGATFKARNLRIHGHDGIGLCVDGSQATLCGGSIFDIDSVSGGSYGRGCVVRNRATLTLHGVLIYDVYEAGVAVFGAGSQATLDNGVVVRQVKMSGDSQLGLGVLGQSGAAVVLEDVTLSDLSGPGVYLSNGASATLSRTSISRSEAAGIAVYGSALTIDQSTIESTQSNPAVGAGIGVFIDNTRLGASTVKIANSTVSRNQYAGVWVNGDGGSVSVTGSTLAHNVAVDLGRGIMSNGNGVFAQNVCTGLTLSGNRYQGNGGGHVFLKGSNATLSGSSYISNGIFDFTQQDCGVACVNPLTESSLSVDGLAAATHILSLCPKYDDPVIGVPDIVFGIHEVDLQQ